MEDQNLKFARNGLEMTMDFLLQLSSGEFKKNIIVSPLSIQTCVALAFAGADGETANEIVKGMKFISTQHSEVAASFRYVLEQYSKSEILKIANKVYVQKNRQIKQQYEVALKENYLAETEVVNFGDSEKAAQEINSWVKQKTAGKITDLIPSNCLNDDTRLVLLNAIHFKGDWENKFDEDVTKEGDFWVNKDNAVKVQYMHKKGKFGFKQLPDLKCTALEMPYKDSQLSMLVLLPDEREGLKDLVKKLKSVNLVDVIDDIFSTTVNVKFPKFKIEFSVELKEMLQKLGINKMFGGGSEFQNMLEQPEDIFVSHVFHKACIEVNEEGTEAAAATGMVMMLRCAVFDVTETFFEADHPFVYMIWNQQKNVLFAGIYANSTKTS